MSNVYETPKSGLVNESGGEDQFGSIEKGLSGDYEFSISAVLNEAWEKVSGTKLTFFLAALIYIGVFIGLSIVFQIIIGVIISTLSPGVAVVIGLIQQIIFSLIILPIAAGLFMLGIRRAADASIQPGSILGYFSKMLPLFFTTLLMSIMIFIGFLLLILPGIYLTIAYYMAVPLVVEKGLGPWEALETSRKVITKRWFTMLFFGIVMSIIVFISAIPLFIGLIWTIPLMAIGYGIIYRNMFGIRKETLTEA